MKASYLKNEINKELEEEQNLMKRKCQGQTQERSFAQNLDSGQSHNVPCVAYGWRKVGKAKPCKEEQEKKEGMMGWAGAVPPSHAGTAVPMALGEKPQRNRKESGLLSYPTVGVPRSE